MITSTVTFTVHFTHEEDSTDLFVDDISEAIFRSSDEYAPESFNVVMVDTRVISVVGINGTPLTDWDRHNLTALSADLSPEDAAKYADYKEGTN